ncbi:MAG: hypothetical protein ACOCY3_03970 [Desulfosalsimonas sp.]
MRFPEEARVGWGFVCCGASHLLTGVAGSAVAVIPLLFAVYMGYLKISEKRCAG